MMSGCTVNETLVYKCQVESRCNFTFEVAFIKIGLNYYLIFMWSHVIIESKWKMHFFLFLIQNQEYILYFLNCNKNVMLFICLSNFD